MYEFNMFQLPMLSRKLKHVQLIHYIMLPYLHYVTCIGICTCTCSSVNQPLLLAALARLSVGVDE